MQKLLKILKLLKVLYEYFEENLYTPSERYSTLRKEHIEISDELEKTFTPDLQQLFEKQWEIGNELCAEENEQLFLSGYIIAKEFDSEIKKLLKLCKKVWSKKIDYDIIFVDYCKREFFIWEID